MKESIKVFKCVRIEKWYERVSSFWREKKVKEMLEKDKIDLLFKIVCLEEENEMLRKKLKEIERRVNILKRILEMDVFLF